MSISGHLWKWISGLLAFLLLMGATSLMAQTSGTGALTGTAKDASGAVVPNAMITITNLDSGQVRTATTGADGAYNFNLLPPGRYRVRFDAAGFKPVEIPSATVNVTETEVLDRALEVGAQSQSVTVQGEVEVIQTTSSALGTVATARTMTELPLNTRNFTNLVGMSAGVASQVANATQVGKGATNMSVNGGGTEMNNYLIDGVTVYNFQSVTAESEGLGFASFAMPNPDAISEFKIQTSNYDAGYGRNPGANVNLITKSGTNNFHGDAFEFFRNTALNANDWFFNRQGLPKAVLNSNIYGGTFGGPVKKDKLFAFVSYQENDQKNGDSAFSQAVDVLPPIPDNAPGSRGTCGPAGWSTIASCNAAGAAFVQQLAANMCTSKPKFGTALIQCPSAGPGDPAGLFNMNPIAISVLQLQVPGGQYLVPGSGTRGYVSQDYSIPATFKDHQGIGNVDYVINSKNTFAGRFLYEEDPMNAPFPSQNSQASTNNVPGTPFFIERIDVTGLARVTSILSNNVVNEAYISYQRNHSIANQNSTLTSTEVGIQPFVSPYSPGGLVTNLPYFNINGGGAGQEWFGYHPNYVENTLDGQYVIGDQVSWNHGKHTFRAGVESERVQFFFLSPVAAGGRPTFPTTADFLLGRQGCGAGVVTTPGPANPAGCNGSTSSNLTGSGAFANNNFQSNLRDLELAVFFQDDIKVNARLTVNLGLRWELDQFATNPNGDFATFWPSLVNSGPSPLVTTPYGPGSSLTGFVVPSNYTGIIPQGVYQSPLPYLSQQGAPWDDFAPRAGFAWQPTSSNKLVLRAGAGYFYDVLGGHDADRFDQMVPTHAASGTGPALSLYNPWGLYAPGLVFAGPNEFGFYTRWVDVSTPVSNPANPAANCPVPPCSSNLSPVTSSSQNMTVPLTYEWNMNAQYELFPSWVVEVGYVGSHGIHQATPALKQGPGNTGAYGSSDMGQPYNYAQLAGVGAPCVSCGATGVTTNTVANAVLRVPLLGISTAATNAQTVSNYSYNALQATLRKQFSKGLQVQAAYTYAVALEQTPQSVNTYPYLIQTYSPEYFVRPQRLVINYVWDLPLGHQKGFLGKVTDGWSWSGVTVIQDGEPVDLQDTNGGRIFGLTSGGGPPQLCPGITASQILTSGSITQRVTNGLNGGDGWLNSAAFCNPSTVGVTTPGTGGAGFGTAGQGMVLGPPESNWDMSLAKMIKVRENQNLQFRAEFYNTWNHAQFNYILYDTNAADRLTSAGGTGAGFGSIQNTAVNPRIIQFALKYFF